MKILALDISTSAGWSFFEDDRLVSFGTIGLDKTVREYGVPYPWNYVAAADDMALMLIDKILEIKPDVLVIEETNLGRARYSQKTLEFLHKTILDRLNRNGIQPKVIYISSSTWRKTLGLTMSKEDKRNNNRLSAAKRKSAELGTKLDKGKLGIRGKINKKHLALRYVNETYGLSLKVKDNDAADAICLVAAYLKGCEPCDGVF